MYVSEKEHGTVKRKKGTKKQQLLMPPKFVFVSNVMWYFNYNA